MQILGSFLCRDAGEAGGGGISLCVHYGTASTLHLYCTDLGTKDFFRLANNNDISPAPPPPDVWAWGKKRQ